MGVLFVLTNALFLAASLLLDARDLVYKTKWIGPFDSYAFSGVGDHVLNQRQLLPVVHFNTSKQLRASGWSSFLANCDELFGSTFFLSVLGTNCSISRDAVVSRLVMTATIRVDSVAWASCQLLHYNRRPGICHERMVTHFLRRYAIETPRLQRTDLARKDSDAERELLLLLSVVSRSSRLDRVVCVEAFELIGVGVYTPNLFGCGSADDFAAAFAGHHATSLRKLLGDKAWLTLDELNVMGLRFAVRQNDRSEYRVRITGDGLIVASHVPHMNYSTSGHLYPIVVLFDLIVTTLNLLSAMLAVRVLLVPQLRFHLGWSDRRVSFFFGSSWMSLAPRSLIRCRPVAVLCVLSQLISWQLVMPNAVIWAWTKSSAGRWQALLSSLRVYELATISFVWCWELVVAVIGEHTAYAITRRTYVSSTEVLVVFVILALLRRADLLSISDAKYASDGQRLRDERSFAGAQGYSNVYNDGAEAVNSAYWTIVYGPLLRLVVDCLAAFFSLALLRMAFFSLTRRFPSQQHYARVPVETLLNVPIRATSLLRSRLDMELETSGTSYRYLYAPLIFDYGSVIDTHGNVLRRAGFVDPIPPCIDLSVHIPVKDSVARGWSSLSHRVTATVSVLARRAQRQLTSSRRESAAQPPEDTNRNRRRALELPEAWAERNASFNVPVR